MRNLKFGFGFALMISGVFLVGCKSEKKDQPPAGAGPGKPAGPLAVEAYIVKPTVLSNTIEVPGSLLPF